MPLKRSLLRTIAIAYAVLVGLVACWAWYIDVKLLNSAREHLAPDIFLAILTIPSSFTADWIYQRWPESFTGLAQTGYLTVCAIVQAGVLLLFSIWLERHDEA